MLTVQESLETDQIDHVTPVAIKRYYITTKQAQAGDHPTNRMCADIWNRTTGEFAIADVVMVISPTIAAMNRAVSAAQWLGSDWVVTRLWLPVDGRAF